MNPRAYRLQLGIILLGILAWIPVVSAQNPVIADDAKGSGPTTATRADKQKYIQFYANALKGDDLEARTQAREALVSGAVVKSGPQPTAAYLDEYSELLNAALKPLAADPNMAVRLNAAIVASKVSEKADNTRMLDVTLTLLGDKTEGVQLWALRAAHSVLPAELRVPGAAKNDKLIPAIVAVAQQRKSGSIATEAYQALTLDHDKTERSKGIPPAVKAEMYGAVLPHVLALLRSRIAEYNSGTINDPSAERFATKFLVSTNVWPNLDQKSQSAALQALLDLMYASGQAAAKLGGPGKYDDVVQTMRDTARALTAWITITKLPGAEALNRGLQEIWSTQNMKPWEQLPQVIPEMTKLDKTIKAPGDSPSTAPAGK